MKAVTALIGLVAIFLAIGSAVAQAGHGWPEGAVRINHPVYDAPGFDDDASEDQFVVKRATPAQQAQINNWKGKCVAKHAAIANAIQHFCKLAGPSNHVPRVWTIAGSHSDNSKYQIGAHVSISGSCFPQQWVPTKYCYLQFYQMCVQDPASSGGGSKSFGKGGCQSWNIDRYQQPPGFAGIASKILLSQLIVGGPV